MVACFLKYIIDPKIPSISDSSFIRIEKGAVKGTKILKEKLKTL